MTDQYQYKTTPYPHQEREFMRSRDAKTWALFMEQRTGKTKVTLDTVAYNYLRGKIDALLVVAPPGVHTQWIVDEVVKHLPDHIPHQTLIYRAGRAPKTFAHNLNKMIQCPDLAILSINTRAFITPVGRSTVDKFLKARKVLWAFDESADIRTPSTKTTKLAITLGKKAVMRRVLAGVPAPEGPMDEYSQYRFLHPGLIGAKNFLEFKLHHAEWDIIERGTMRRVSHEEAFNKAGYMRKGFFMLLKKDKEGKPKFKNIEELRNKLAWRTSRVTQQEAFPHLPPKMYKKFYVDLNPEQLRIYNQLAEEYLAELKGRVLEAPLVITRLLRLQQVISGYLPLPVQEDLPEDFDWFAEGGNHKVKHEIVRIPGTSARVEILDEILDHRDDNPCIIWCRFKPDIDLLMDHYKSRGVRAERYDGSVRQDVREITKQEFQAGHIPILIGNQKAGGTGLSLRPAETVIYFSNYFGLLPRLQSEDRPIHAELKRPVLYADVIARDTMEEKLVATLANKKDIFQELMGDRDSIQSWFSAAS